MRSVVEKYLDLAIERNQLTSDRHLSRVLKLSATAVNQLRKNKTLPHDDTMRDLARLAGIPEEVALLELNMLRSSGTTQEVYKAILKKLSGVLSVLVIATIFLFYFGSDAHAATEIDTAIFDKNIHYHT